jgi:hypothetical protein
MEKRAIVGKDFIEVSNMSLGQSDRWGGGKFWHGRRNQCFECRAAYLIISQKEGPYEHYIHPGPAK